MKTNVHLWQYVEKIQVSLKSDKNNGYFTLRQWCSQGVGLGRPNPPPPKFWSFDKLSRNNLKVPKIKKILLC
jgi:hypothetical protein